MTPPSTEPPFPFIVGVGRSGTTLMRSLLDAHPELAVVHESRFVAWMARNHRDYEPDHRLDVELFLRDLLDNPDRRPSRLDAWDVDPEIVRRTVLEGAPANLAGAIRLVYRAYATANGKARYGDKTPGYLRHLEPIAALLPEARFVHLVRDGRDVALSMLDVDFGGANVAHAAWLWSRRVLRAQQTGTRLTSGRYLVVRYEDLVADSERVLTTVCGFLSLPYDASMLRYFEQQEAVFRGLGDQAHHEHLRLPVTGGLRDWRHEMGASDVERFERVAGEALATFGYEVATEPGAGGVTDRLVDAVRIADGRARSRWRAHRRQRRR